MGFASSILRYFKKAPAPLRFNELATGKETILCVDMGAFPKTIPDLGGVSGVVIMEDRLPEFFLSYSGYQAISDAGLNRHGPNKFHKTHKDLRNIVTELQNKSIKVYLGFWGQYKGVFGESTLWLKAHPELRPRDSRSSDLNPLAHLKEEGVSFAEYVGQQYTRIQRDFGFDGLFLGDGLNGYRVFADPDAEEDHRFQTMQWINFYRSISSAVHRTGGKLLAYDCMGFAPKRAMLHGSDYRGQAAAGLDYIIVQTYPEAWGNYHLKNRPGFDWASALDHLKRTREAVRPAVHTKVLYTLEVGDSVEKWYASAEHSKRQQAEFDAHADGKLVVWGNDMIANLKSNV